MDAILTADTDTLTAPDMVSRATWADASRAIGIAIDTFTPAECAKYFAAAGYDAY